MKLLAVALIASTAFAEPAPTTQSADELVFGKALNANQRIEVRKRAAPQLKDITDHTFNLHENPVPFIDPPDEMFEYDFRLLDERSKNSTSLWVMHEFRAKGNPGGWELRLLDCTVLDGYLIFVPKLQGSTLLWVIDLHDLTKPVFLGRTDLHHDRSRGPIFDSARIEGNSLETARLMVKQSHPEATNTHVLKDRVRTFLEMAKHPMAIQNRARQHSATRPTSKTP